MKLQDVPFMVSSVQNICDYVSLFEGSDQPFNQEFFLGKDTISISYNLGEPWKITVNAYSWSEMIHSYKQLSQSIQNVLDREHKK